MQNQSFVGSLFGFSGRMNRLGFFLRILFIIIFPIAVGFLMGMIAPFLAILGALGFLFAIMIFIAVIVMIIALIISFYSLEVRRIHDIGLSGFWILALIILSCVSFTIDYSHYNFSTDALNYAIMTGQYQPSMLNIINSLVQLGAFLVLLFWPGTKGSNQYGPDRLGRDFGSMAEVFGNADDSRYYSYYPDAEKQREREMRTANMPQASNVGPAKSRGTKLDYTRKH